MLTNSLAVNERLSVYIATETDCCNKCLEAHAKEQHITYTKAREELKGALVGQKVFKLRYHGGTYILCPEHIKQIAALTTPADGVINIDELTGAEKAALIAQLSHIQQAAPTSKENVSAAIENTEVKPVRKVRKKVEQDEA